MDKKFEQIVDIGCRRADHERMVIFGGRGIGELREQGRIKWSGEIRGDALLLKLGGPLQELIDPGHAIDPRSPGGPALLGGTILRDWDSYILAPSQLLLAQVSERLSLDAGFTGVIGTLSHVARFGLMTHLASPFVEGGWGGHITLELLNVGPAAIVLGRAMPIAKLMVLDTVNPTEQPRRHGYGQAGELVSNYDVEFGWG